MPSLSNEQRAAIAIGVPVVALLLFLWYRKRRSTSNFQDEDEDATMEESENIASANQRTIEVKVPRSVVGAIIGKSGANIKKIEKDSGARVTMKDEEESSESGERVVLIQGGREKAKRAEILVKKIIAEQPMIRTEEIFVPQRACGRIIGKGGQTIRKMSSLSGARIKISSDNQDMSSPLHKCLITGTSDQIASAKGLLDEKIAEDNEVRARRGDSGMPRNRRAPRKLETAQASSTTGVLQFPKTDEFCGVFVSAIDNPGHFWVQLLTKDSPELDKLTTELTLMYSSSETHAVLNAFKVGDICCAPFEYDSSWYRARIVEINKDGTVELYYVDFGDSGQMSKEKLRELKKEHNRLPFQAIECYLAGVKPSGEEWSKESTDDFDHLTHCAQWVSLMARVLKYSGDIPYLELTDTTGETDVNINEEMIKRQFAVRDVSSPPQEQGQDLLQNDAKEAGLVLQETPEVIKQNRGELQQSTPPISGNRGVSGETESVQKQNISNVVSETASQDFTDAPLSGDGPDGKPAELHVAVAPEIDSPVKAALVKTISQDYIPISDSSSPDMSAPDQGNVANLGVVQEQGVVDLQPDAATLDHTYSANKKRENEAVFQSELNLQPKVPRLDLTNFRKRGAEDQLGGYRSSLNILPSSRRTMAASFSGTRHASERSETSVKSVTSTVRQQVVSSKQSYVSTVTIPDHSDNSSNVIVSVTPSVTQLTEGSPFDLENHAFRASNESTTFTQHAVTSEVRRTVTQTNGSDTKTDLSASRLEEKLTSHSSSADDKETVTYEIKFEGTPGTDPYTIKKKYTSSLEDAPFTSGAFGEMSPSGSLLEISSNTVIEEEEEEEEEYEQEQVDKANGASSKSARSESPEPDSDTESFMSAKEDMISDTDTAAYMTAGGSSASLYTDAVSLVDSSAEEATTPVNSDTEVEDEEEDIQGSDTPQAHEREETGDRSRKGTLKGLREQTSILGSDVTSDGDLGYRGDSEEELASNDDLRTTGT